MRCYNRFFNDVYLLTCLKPDGHGGFHKDDRGETWTNEQGFFDQYGEKKRSATELLPTMTDLMVEPESVGPFLDANPQETIKEPHDGRVFIYHTATVSQESIDASAEKPGDVVSVEELVDGCYNCRQGNHDRCAFAPEYCACKKKGHEATR